MSTPRGKQGVHQQDREARRFWSTSHYASPCKGGPFPAFKAHIANQKHSQRAGASTLS